MVQPLRHEGTKKSRDKSDDKTLIANDDTVVMEIKLSIMIFCNFKPLCFESLG
jgi:hypothetical protein